MAAPLFKKNLLFASIFLFQLFRIFLLPFIGLMPQDAYYYLYAENLSLSYYDHPGMIGYMLKVFTEIFGKSALTLKFADFTVTSLTIYVFYLIAKELLPKTKALQACVLMVSSVMVSMLSFNSTPDTPLLLFWSLSVWSLYRAIFREDAKHWLWAGFFMGLAFNSKYTALLLPIGLLGFIIFSKDHKKLLRSKYLWSSLLLFLVLTIPVIYWNVDNNFVSFKLQGANRTGNILKFNFQPKDLLGTLGTQAFLILPVSFFIMLTFSLKYIKRAILHFKFPKGTTLFLLCFFLPIFLGFLFISPFYWVKINWLTPAYLTGLLLTAMFISKKWLNYQLIIAILLHILIAVEIVFYSVPIKSDDTWYGWEKLATGVEELNQDYPNSFIFSADGYKTSSVLNFYLEQKVYSGNVVGRNGLEYSIIDSNLAYLSHKNAIYIDSQKRFKNLGRSNTKRNDLLKYFKEVQELEPLLISDKNGNPKRKFLIYKCIDYDPEIISKGP